MYNPTTQPTLLPVGAPQAHLLIMLHPSKVFEMPLLSRCRVLCTVYPTQIIIFMEYPKLVLWGRGLDVPGATGHFFGIPCKYYFQLGARQREKNVWRFINGKAATA